jgi:UDPglucose 6-dehydrogenase
MDEKNHFVLIVKSTVPVGTNKIVEEKVKSVNAKLDFGMASNPEFSKQGFAIQDFLKPDRIVAGVHDEKTGNVIKKIYEPLTKQGYQLFITKVETAEMIKYASNGFLAIKIAFINEIADICERTGADIEEVAMMMGKDNRINPKFLQAGPGVGGSCFPKDSAALSAIGKGLGLDVDLISASVISSKKRIKLMAEKVLKSSKDNLKGKKIAVFGLTFKANTDDVRRSPSLDIIKELIGAGVKIQAYDPKGIPPTKRSMTNEELASMEFFDNAPSACKDAELLAIMTEWDEFKFLDYKKIGELLKNKTLVDLRNILKRDEIEVLGYKYVCIGK